jgi:hypothetical protein
MVVNLLVRRVTPVEFLDYFSKKIKFSPSLAFFQRGVAARTALYSLSADALRASGMQEFALLVFCTDSEVLAAGDQPLRDEFVIPPGASEK